MHKLVVLVSLLALAAARPGVGVVAPLAYSAAVTPGVNSLSQYSTSVVHGSPVVAPVLHSAPVVAPTLISAVGPAVVPAVSAISQAPHSPAVVIDAVHGVPLDTPEVVAARAAHLQTKVLSGVHHLGKRSVSSLVAPVVHSAVVAPVGPVAYSAPLVTTPVVASPLVSSPVVSAYSSVVPGALSIHPW